MLLHLIRHGPPLIAPQTPASTWSLDPSATSGLQRLRAVVEATLRSPQWFSSDEPKALATAQRLTDGEVAVEPALREVVRSDWFASRDEFNTAAMAGFAEPDRPARPGWEPLAATRARVSAAVGRIVAGAGAPEVVLVGHGTAWTLLVSELTGRPPDLVAWRRLRTPDLCTLDLRTRSVVRAWGDW